MPDLSVYINQNNKKKYNKKILIATSAGGLKAQLVFESMLAVGLDFYDAEVEFLLCDEILPTCIISTFDNSNETDLIKNKKQNICDFCFKDAKEYLKKGNFRVLKFSDFITNEDFRKILDEDFSELSQAEIKNFRQDEIKIGEHAFSGALRYYAKTDLYDENNSQKILIKYLKSSLISKKVAENIFNKRKYDHLLLNHGIYVPHGVILDVARKRGVATSTWCPGYKKNSFCLTLGDTYHRSLIYESNSKWENIKFEKEEEKKIDEYLESRKFGKNDWIHFYKKKPDLDYKSYFEKIGIDNTKPLYGLATSVLWDAQIDFPSNFFKNQLDWVFTTIDFFSKNKDLQLLIRISPAESNFGKPSRQRVAEEIIKRYKKIPENIFIVQPDDPISSYALLENTELIFIYGTRMGIELAARGKKVIVCGEGFIRNKNIALDVKSKEHYIEILEEIKINNLEKFVVDQKKAKKYAYYFFFSKMFQFYSIEENNKKWPNFTISKNFRSHLMNKSDPALEQAIISILNNEDFILKYEKN